MQPGLTYRRVISLVAQVLTKKVGRSGSAPVLGCSRSRLVWVVGSRETKSAAADHLDVQELRAGALLRDGAKELMRNALRNQRDDQPCLTYRHVISSVARVLTRRQVKARSAMHCPGPKPPRRDSS